MRKWITGFSYGLTEFSNLTSQKFVANPGCYATATELALIPLLQKKMVDPSSVIVDAKSGLVVLVKFQPQQVILFIFRGIM